MKYLITLLLLIGADAFADDWICKEESLQRSGDSYHACGIGYGPNEAQARMQAFMAAKNEFNQACSVSDDCIDHAVTLDPGRTTCEPSSQGYKCYRLEIFNVAGGSTNHSIKSGNKPVSFISKLRLGMKKKEILRRFGRPVVVNKALGSKNTLIYRYNKTDKCTYYCTITLNNDQVTHFSGWGAEYDGRI